MFENLDELFEYVKQNPDISINYDLNNKTFHLSSSLEFANGTKTALEINNIIYRSSNITRGFNIEVDYNLNNYALKVLNRNVKQGNIVIKRDSFCFNIK